MKTFKQFILEVYEYKHVDGMKVHNTSINGHSVETTFDNFKNHVYLTVSVNGKTLHQSDIHPKDRSAIAIKTSKVVSDYIDKEKPTKINAYALNHDNHNDHFARLLKHLGQKHGYSYSKYSKTHVLTKNPTYQNFIGRVGKSIRNVFSS